MAPSFRSRQFLRIGFSSLAAQNSVEFIPPVSSTKNLSAVYLMEMRRYFFFRWKFILRRKSTWSAFAIVCGTFPSGKWTTGDVRKGKWVNVDLCARTRESICEFYICAGDPAPYVPFRFREKSLTSRRGRRKSIAAAVCRCDARVNQACGRKIERTKKARRSKSRLSLRSRECNKRDDGRRHACVNTYACKFDILNDALSSCLDIYTSR